MYDLKKLTSKGITFSDASALRRIAITLHQWHELKCDKRNQGASWCIVRGLKSGDVFNYDEAGKPYVARHFPATTRPTFTRTFDLERGALRRLAVIMQKYPALSAYVQANPRAYALYIGRNLTETNFDSGTAVHQ